MSVIVYWLVRFINSIPQALFLVLVAHMIASWTLEYYHPVRQWLERLVEPMLRPIRRIVPLVGMVDISPLILIILVQLIAAVVSNILLSLFP